VLTDKLLTVAQGCEQLQVAEETAGHWLRAKQLPEASLGGTTLHTAAGNLTCSSLRLAGRHRHVLGGRVRRSPGGGPRSGGVLAEQMPDEHGGHDVRPVPLAAHETGERASPSAAENRAAAGKAGDVTEHLRQIHQ